MKILVVEDDGLQAEYVSSQLQRVFPGSVALIKTENEFVTSIEKIRQSPPDVVVMDIMLRWTVPSTEMPPRPDNIRKEGFYRAGFRCRDLLAQNEITRNIPVIFYTVLEREDLNVASMDSIGTTIYLRKDAELDPLIREIRNALGRIET